MSTITIGLIMFVALEFLFIMYLETFATTSKRTQRVFNLSKEEFTCDEAIITNTLFKNQGIYNGLIGIGLLYSVFLSASPVELSRLLLIYIILVALYGSITSDKKIILTQGGLAILALIATFF